jgi:hypothetical protein
MINWGRPSCTGPLAGMPADAVGRPATARGPIEDPDRLKIPKTRVLA